MQYNSWIAGATFLIGLLSLIYNWLYYPIRFKEAYIILGVDLYIASSVVWYLTSAALFFIFGKNEYLLMGILGFWLAQTPALVIAKWQYVTMSEKIFLHMVLIVVSLVFLTLLPEPFRAMIFGLLAGFVIFSLLFWYDNERVLARSK